MVKIFSTKIISGKPYDAMDTTFFAIFHRFSENEIIYYAEAPDNFKETGAMRKIPLKYKNKLLRLIEKIIFLRKLKPDYLFGYGSVLELPFLLFKPRKSKYIINFHSILVKKGNSNWTVRTPWFLRKFLFNKADFIVAISEFAKKTITDLFPHKDVKMIYSGAEPDFFTPQKENRPALRKKFNIDFNAPLVAFVGTLQPRKRPDIFIEVAKQCKEANFVIVGREDGVHDYLKGTVDLKNFQYIEMMEREEVAQLFASADIFLFPSIQETFGAVVVEAMASGIPVIVSHSGAFPELVRDKLDGFLVPVNQNEIETFVSDIRKILKDKNLYNFLSENAIRDAENFSWQKTSDNYKKILVSGLKNMDKKNKRAFLKLKTKDSLKRLLPQPIIKYIRKIRNLFYSRHKFNYEKAQQYELEGQIYFLETNRETVENYYKVFEESKNNNYFDDYGLKSYFGDNKDRWQKFCLDIKDKICLEIGSGPMGLVPRWYWAKKRILIEPLLNEYKETSLRLFGKTFLTDDIKLYSQDAEIFIKELENKIDGCIVSTNALDHSDNPIKILENISRYAKKGCRFLFWSTLYYPHGHNEGHRNIVRTKEEFEEILKSLGFVIESTLSEDKLPANTHDDLIYGCLAKKV